MLVVTESHDLDEARDVLERVANDRADLPCHRTTTTTRRSRATGSNASAVACAPLRHPRVVRGPQSRHRRTTPKGCRRRPTHRRHGTTPPPPTRPRRTTAARCRTTARPTPAHARRRPQPSRSGEETSVVGQLDAQPGQPTPETRRPPSRTNRPRRSRPGPSTPRRARRRRTPRHGRHRRSGRRDPTIRRSHPQHPTASQSRSRLETDIHHLGDVAQALTTWRQWADGHSVRPSEIQATIETLGETGYLNALEARTIIDPIADWALRRTARCRPIAGARTGHRAGSRAVNATAHCAADADDGARTFPRTFPLTDVPFSLWCRQRVGCRYRASGRRRSSVRDGTAA